MANVPTASEIITPIAGPSGSRHQRVRAPNSVRQQPSYFAPVPVAENLPGGVVGAAYSETISAQLGTPPYTFSVASGSLPSGTSLSSAGVISGAPTTEGTSTFAVEVTDANGFTGQQDFEIAVDSASVGQRAYAFAS